MPFDETRERGEVRIAAANDTPHSADRPPTRGLGLAQGGEAGREEAGERDGAGGLDALLELAHGEAQSRSHLGQGSGQAACLDSGDRRRRLASAACGVDLGVLRAGAGAHTPPRR